MKKCAELGIPVKSEEDFYAMLPGDDSIEKNGTPVQASLF